MEFGLSSVKKTATKKYVATKKCKHNNKLQENFFTLFFYFAFKNLLLPKILFDFKILFIFEEGMKVLILGYGRMGKLIESVCIEKGIQVIEKIDTKKELENFLNKNEQHCIKENISLEMFYKEIVCIDFSSSEAFLENIQLICKNKINIICGTTGWQEKEEYVKQIIEKNNIGFLYASNFSIGVNLFFKIIASASKLINNFNSFDVMVNEAHHKNKIDSPSGTAITTANIILKNFTRKNKILSQNPNRALKDEELFVSSTRGGEIFGEHNVIFDDIQNQISIKHIAKDKKSFASGAVDVATWIERKKGYFSIDDYFFDKGLL